MEFVFVLLGGWKRGMKRGVPNVLMNLDNRAKKINHQLLPSTDTAMQQYSATTGGTISEPCSFGTDPLEADPRKMMIRYESFCSQFSLNSLFCEASNGCGSSFCNALKFLIDVSYRLSHSS